MNHSETDLKRIAVRSVLLEAADDSLGIYPQAVLGGDNPYEKRTEWMEGWNAAVTARTGAMVKIEQWHKDVPEKFRPVVDDMLIDGRIQVVCSDGAVRMYVDCSDLFFWACADAEEISFDELNDLSEYVSISPGFGGLMWCAKKRGMRPQKPYYKLFSKAESEILDGFGPERDDE